MFWANHDRLYGARQVKNYQFEYLESWIFKNFVDSGDLVPDTGGLDQIEKGKEIISELESKYISSLDL